VEIAANRMEIVEALRGYFVPFTAAAEAPADILITVHEAEVPEIGGTFVTKEPEPGKTRIKEEYIELQNGRIVRKRLTGLVFVFGGDDHVVVGPCLENLNQVVNFVNNRHIEWMLCRGCLLGHAAGVARNGRGLALAGFAGAGKSTLALHLMSHGVDFVSNDRLIVEPEEANGLRMHGVAKLPRINPGTAMHNQELRRVMPPEDWERFAELDEDELWEIEHKYDVPIDECFGPDRFVLSAPMHGLAILNWKHGAGALRVRSVDPRERHDLLPAFMKSPGLFFLPSRECAMPEPTAENYAELLSRCTVLELSGGLDFDLAVDSCLNFLKTGKVDRTNR
jgi:HprK-related kinase B